MSYFNPENIENKNETIILDLSEKTEEIKVLKNIRNLKIVLEKFKKL